METSDGKKIVKNILNEKKDSKDFSRRLVGSVNPLYEICKFYEYMPSTMQAVFTYAMQFNPDNSLVRYTYLFLFYK